METEKLAKSVATLAPKASFWDRAAPFVIVYCLVTLIALPIMYSKYSEVATSNDIWARDYFASQDTNEMLKKENARLRYDINELDSAEAVEILIRGKQSRDDVHACVEQPEGLLVQPWVVGMNNRDFFVQNPEPIMSTSEQGDYWFVPGSVCGIDNTGAVSVTRKDDVYILRAWTPPVSPARAYAACPDSAYHLVSVGNEVIREALWRACKNKIKARDLGLLGH